MRLVVLIPAKDSLFLASDTELATAFPDWLRRAEHPVLRRRVMNPFTKAFEEREVWFDASRLPPNFETHVDVDAFEELPQVRCSHLRPEDIEDFYDFIKTYGTGAAPAEELAFSEPLLIAHLPSIATEVGDTQQIYVVPRPFVEAVATLYQDQVEEIGSSWAWSQRRKAKKATRSRGIMARWFGRAREIEVSPVVPEIARPKRLRLLRALARQAKEERKPMYLWWTTRDD